MDGGGDGARDAAWEVGAVGASGVRVASSTGGVQALSEADPVFPEIFGTVHGGVRRTDESLFHLVRVIAVLSLQRCDPHAAGNYPFDIQGRFSRGKSLTDKDIAFERRPQRFTILARIFEGVARHEDDELVAAEPGRRGS